MGAEQDNKISRAGQRAALAMAGTAVFWIVATYLGGELGLSNRTRALFDLMALAGFGFALWMTYQVWRLRQNEKG
jgi:threonine/homoserine/homoserine lactone efflux protein